MYEQKITSEGRGQGLSKRGLPEWRDPWCTVSSEHREDHEGWSKSWEKPSLKDSFHGACSWLV